MTRVIAALLAAVLLAGCDHVQVGQSPDPEADSGWQRLPDFPLAERSGPVVAWTGTEVLAVGGDTGEECPPNADCARPNAAATDGAALDPVTGRWRQIAEAPVPIPANTGGVAVAGRLYLLVAGTLIAYDPIADRWSTVRRELSDGYTLAADRDRLILVNGSDENGTRPDLVLDPAREQWSRLPADPLGPSYDRSLVSTTAGLVLAGHDVVPSPGAGPNPSYLEAALLDRRTNRWRTFGPSGLLGGSTWSAAGKRVVTVGLGGSDGGGEPPGDYGREVPHGGTLDTSTGAWTPLPRAPEPMSGGWAVYAPEGALIATEGYLYAPDSGEWTRIPRPAGSDELPGPAVWAGETLIVITTVGAGRDDWAHLRNNASWSWTPRAARQ